MAILADAGAVRLLLSMVGNDDAKQRHITNAIARGTSATAARVDEAVAHAQAYLTVRGNGAGV